MQLIEMVIWDENGFDLEPYSWILLADKTALNFCLILKSREVMTHTYLALYIVKYDSCFDSWNLNLARIFPADNKNNFTTAQKKLTSFHAMPQRNALQRFIKNNLGWFVCIYRIVYNGA